MHLPTWSEYATEWHYRDDPVGVLDAQRDLGAPESGVWDETTARIAARTPRCGCLDVQNLGESRWGLPEVTWGVQSYPGGVSNDRALAIFHAAFQSWTAVCGLKFKQVNTNPNILIGAGRGPRSNFDGRGGTLAWAYLPRGNNFKGQLEVRFDLDEAWTDNPNSNGILLLNVAAHEFGHAIGLSHNNVRAQLLNPIYNRAIAAPQSFDISQVQTLYGKPVAQPTPANPTQPGTPTSDVNAVKIQLVDGRVFGASRNQPLALLPANALTGPEYAF